MTAEVQAHVNKLKTQIKQLESKENKTDQDVEKIAELKTRLFKAVRNNRCC